MKFLSCWSMALGAFLVSMLTQCSDYNKMLKSGNLEEKLSYAEAALDSGNCFRALPLYDELMRLTRGGHTLAVLPRPPGGLQSVQVCVCV